MHYHTRTTTLIAGLSALCFPSECKVVRAGAGSALPTLGCFLTLGSKLQRELLYKQPIEKGASDQQGNSCFPTQAATGQEIQALFGNLCISTDSLILVYPHAGGMLMEETQENCPLIHLPSVD